MLGCEKLDGIFKGAPVRDADLLRKENNLLIKVLTDATGHDREQRNALNDFVLVGFQRGYVPDHADVLHPVGASQITRVYLTSRGLLEKISPACGPMYRQLAEQLGIEYAILHKHLPEVETLRDKAVHRPGDPIFHSPHYFNLAGPDGARRIAAFYEDVADKT